MISRAATRAELSEKRRRALVLTAYREIAEVGFEGLRTREVAAEVGVNVATLHYYFPTKEALIRGVVEHAMERFRSTLEPHGSPKDQLRNYLHGVRRLLVQEPELGAVMAELVLRSVRDRATGKILEQMYATWLTTTRGLLRRAVKEGALRPEMDSDAVAAMIVSTVTAMTLPVMGATGRGEQALRQLEKWLGITSPRSLVHQSTE